MNDSKKINIINSDKITIGQLDYDSDDIMVDEEEDDDFILLPDEDEL